MCYRIYYKVLHLVKLYGILKMHCLTLQLYQIKKVVISIHIIMKVQQKVYDAVPVYCRSFLCTSYCISNYCHSLLDENDAEPCMVKKKNENKYKGKFNNSKFLLL